MKRDSGYGDNNHRIKGSIFVERIFIFCRNEASGDFQISKAVSMSK